MSSNQGSPSEPFGKYHRDAKEALQCGDWEVARDLIQEWLRAAPGDVRAWCLESELRLGLREWTGAEFALDQVRQLAPEDGQGLCLWARYCLETDRLEEALEAAREAVKVAVSLEERESSCLLFASIALESASEEKVEAGFGEDAWWEDGESYEEFDGEGEFFEEEDVVEEALEALEGFLREWSEHAEGWMMKASLLERIGEEEEALDAWRQAVRLAPEDAGALHGWAKRCEDLEEFEEAHQGYTRLFAVESVAEQVKEGDIRFDTALFAQVAQEAWETIQADWLTPNDPVRFEFSTAVYPSLEMVEQSGPNELFDPRVGLHVELDIMSLSRPTVRLLLFQRNIERDLEEEDETELSLAIEDLLDQCLERVISIFEEAPEDDV